MSALLTPRRPRGRAPREAARAGVAVRPPPPPAAPARETSPRRRAPAVEAPAGRARHHRERAPRQGPTLDDLVAGAWEGLLAGAPASCVVCGTTMHPRYSGGHAPVGGRCTGCGTTLG